MFFVNSKLFTIYAIELLLVMIYNSAAEETCETVPTEIHVTKGT